MEWTPMFYKLLLVSLVWLCVMVHVLWPDKPTAAGPTSPHPAPPRRKRSRVPQPFAGLIHKPMCEACEQTVDTRPQAPGAPPPLISSTRGRKRRIDTQSQFCPDQDCSYFGWLRRGTIRANGHPSGRAWRQLQCVSCHGYFQETHGTIFHGKRVSVDLLIHAIGCLAEDFLPFVNPNLSHFFTPSARPAHNASGWHHNTYDDATWPSGYAGVGRQYCVRPGHAAVPSPATPHIRG